MDNVPQRRYVAKALAHTPLCFKSLFKVTSTAEIRHANKLTSEVNREKTRKKAGQGRTEGESSLAVFSRGARA